MIFVMVSLYYYIHMTNVTHYTRCPVLNENKIAFLKWKVTLNCMLVHLVWLTLPFFPTSSKSSRCFMNAFLHWRGQDLPWQTAFLWLNNISCMWNSQQTELSCIGKWRSSWYYWTVEWFNEGQCVACFDEKQSCPFFLFWRTYEDW
jgi:hypothetical protein